MQLYWQAYNGDTTQTIYQGDALDVLRKLPDESVHCCITSPPYWGLRDYGVDGQIGLEPTPEEYVEKLVAVFREVRRVLRGDGTLWLNLGDRYATSGTRQGNRNSLGRKEGDPYRRFYRCRPIAIKEKDLVGIPWAVAFALRGDGWYLRSDIIWAKPNPMPESVTDRPTKAHEYVFLFAKEPRYYYDADAIREPFADDRMGDPGPYRKTSAQERKANNARQDLGFINNGGGWTRGQELGGRNKRSVWTIATEPFPEAHFATFPTALVEPMILAGTSPKACPKCGASWRRVVERERPADAKPRRPDEPHNSGTGLEPHRGYRGVPVVKELGWEPTCTCPDNDGSGRCVVLDPFVGSGTTLLVAQRLGRSGIGIELNPDYCAMASRRINREQCG